MRQLITNPYSFDAVTIKEDAHGRAIVKAKIMKVGQLRYTDRSGRELYANVSLGDLERGKKSVSLKPITIKHPPNMLMGDDVKLYMEGTSADNAQIEEIDGETWLTNDLVLQTDTAKNVAREGRIGVSAGYYRNAETKGVNIVDFKDIDINHIAIGCDDPRAKGAELYSLDSSESDFGRIYDLDKQQTIKKEVRMKRKLSAVKGQGYSLDEAQIDYVDESDSVIEQMDLRQKTLIGQFDAELDKQEQSFDDANEKLITEVSELKGAKTVLEEENKTLKEQAEKMISMDDVEKTISELADVRTVAETVFSKKEDIPEFTKPIDGIKAVVEKKHPGVSFDDDSQYRGAFAIIKGNPKDNEEMRKSQQALEDAKKKGGASMDDDNEGKFSSWKELKASKQKGA